MRRTVSYLLTLCCFITGCISKIDPVGFTAVQDVHIERGYKTLTVRDGIEVRMSNLASAYIEGDAAAIPYLEINQDDETLDIGLKKNYRLSEGCVLEVHIPDNISISSIVTSGSSIFGTEGYFKFPYNATFTASDDSRIEANVKIGEIHINASGSSKLIFSGIITLAYTNLSGNACLGNDYSATIQSFYTTMSDSSSACFYSNGTIMGEMSGNSVIHYKGTADVKAQTSGGSTIVKEED